MEEPVQQHPPEQPPELEHEGLRAMKLAYRVAGLSASRRATLACLGSHAGPTGRAYPGIDLMAIETDTSRDTVMRSIRELEAIGILKVTRRGWRNGNSYEILIDALAALPMIRER